VQKARSPEGWHFEASIFAPHPLMAGERGGETTSDALVVHNCERWIVFGWQNAGGQDEE